MDRYRAIRSLLRRLERQSHLAARVFWTHCVVVAKRSPARAITPVVRATVAALSADLARDVRAGRVADNPTRDQADRTEDDRPREAPQSGVCNSFVRVGGNRREKNTDGNDNNPCNGFHRLIPFCTSSPARTSLRAFYSIFLDSHFWASASICRKHFLFAHGDSPAGAGRRARR